MNIRPDDFVLEIGSGHDPKVRSDVLCDKFIEDNTQRGGPIVADRMLVAADGQYLPFADKSFDYTICSHVLEHVEEPELLLKELMRVSYRGYIETPSEIAERLYGWPYHNWIVNLINGKLVIQKKVGESQFGQLFHCLAAHDKDFARFHQRYHHLFLVRYEWEGRINYTILPPDPSPLQLESTQAVEELLMNVPEESLFDFFISYIKNSLPQRWKIKIKSFLAKRRKPPAKTLKDIVVCPLCKGEVEWRRNEIICHRCDIAYPIKNGIPYLLIPEERKPMRREE
ncbi:TPA: methyltransferase domain-containing protein [Candidatus Poribacteria bacterium]|nr:methyltransferase domain-containing protein [Candidatus Poribacteria bacterium]